MKYIKTLLLSLLLIKAFSSEEVEIVNSYTNTEELIKKFPVIYSTTIQSGLESKIQNRLLTGFENWNRGFAAWKAWGEILYTQDSIYNVNGARLSLSQYQAAMDISLKRTNIIMGNFNNMIICDDFTAIRYDVIYVNGEEERPGTVMEFVKFKDYGEELGTRVVEGWGGTKSESYDSMILFQGAEEKKIQEEQDQYNLNYEIPEIDDLEKKYPIINPTNYIDSSANDILHFILKGFDSWNQEIENYIKWTYEGYDSEAEVTLSEEKLTMSEYRRAMRNLVKKEKIKKLYFDNILIRDNWAAIHYRYTSEDVKTGEKNCGDRMQFMKFKNENGLKIEASWIH